MSSKSTLRIPTLLARELKASSIVLSAQIHDPFEFARKWQPVLITTFQDLEGKIRPRQRQEGQEIVPEPWMP